MPDATRGASGVCTPRAEQEIFFRDEARVWHDLTLGQMRCSSFVEEMDDRDEDLKGLWWKAYLKGVRPRSTAGEIGYLRTADLFCGPGGLANGVSQMCREAGITVIPELIVDEDEDATLVYAANHGARRRSTRSLPHLIDFGVRRVGERVEFLYPPEVVDSGVASALQGVHLVLAGPPCQGHSNLNNHTRREDPRNALYLTVPAVTVAIGAPLCVIENVPSIVNDSQDVVAVGTQLFESAGYAVETGVLSLSAMGWPQTRKRHFMIARRGGSPIPLEEVQEALSEERPRSLWWAIGDLEDVEGKASLDQASELSAENQSRVDWLFDNDQFDLALPERPASHRQGTTYQSVYGRLRKEEPAQTITTGFMTPGRGRYVHPTRRRALTAHEAARLQGFPDTYEFSPNPQRPASRAKLAKWIGDAVPMPLGYAAALSVLGAGIPR